MAITNKYYVLNLPEPAIDAIIAHADVVGQNLETQRRSNDGNEVIIKTKVRLTTKPVAIPGNSTQYNHEEILQYINDNSDKYGEV